MHFPHFPVCKYTVTNSAPSYTEAIWAHAEFYAPKGSTFTWQEVPVGSTGHSTAPVGEYLTGVQGGVDACAAHGYGVSVLRDQKGRPWLMGSCTDQAMTLDTVAADCPGVPCAVPDLPRRAFVPELLTDLGSIGSLRTNTFTDLWEVEISLWVGQ